MLVTFGKEEEKTARFLLAPSQSIICSCGSAGLHMQERQLNNKRFNSANVCGTKTKAAQSCAQLHGRTLPRGARDGQKLLLRCAALRTAKSANDWTPSRQTPRTGTTKRAHVFRPQQRRFCLALHFRQRGLQRCRLLSQLSPLVLQHLPHLDNPDIQKGVSYRRR